MSPIFFKAFPEKGKYHIAFINKEIQMKSKKPSHILQISRETELLGITNNIMLE